MQIAGIFLRVSSRRINIKDKKSTSWFNQIPRSSSILLRSQEENFKTKRITYWLISDFSDSSFASISICEIFQFSVKTLEGFFIFTKCFKNIPKDDRIIEKKIQVWRELGTGKFVSWSTDFCWSFKASETVSAENVKSLQKAFTS